MSSYKLSYFDARALAEPIRFLLNYLGIEFEDERFGREDWPKMKPNFPWRHVPVLEVDGKQINQSMAICRYLAKEAGLVGKDNCEALEIDAIVDTFHDFRHKIAAHLYETDAELKAQKAEAGKEVEAFFVGKFDEQVKRNGGYFVGGKLTWADLVFFGVLDFFNLAAGHDIIENYENLKALKQKVHQIPAIKAWIAKRPHNIA